MDGDAACSELAIGVEGDRDLAAEAAVGGAVGETVAAEAEGHDNGGGALSELDEMHDVELERGPVAAAGDGVDKVDHGGDVGEAVKAGHDPELIVTGWLVVVVVGGGGGDGAEVAVVVGQGRPGGFVDGDESGGGDEGCEERH